MSENYENVLTIKNLTVAFAGSGARAKGRALKHGGSREYVRGTKDDEGALYESIAVKNVSLELHKGEILALVGESGCGKTVLCKSILGILCDKARILSGEVNFGGTNLLTLSEKELRGYRGGKISMVFQDPMTSLNPTICIGEQIAEAVRLHGALGRAQARVEATELMSQVGISQAEERYRQMPHHFSGGMRQRAAIATALAGKPEILLADEPTTALDVEMQEQILALLKEIQKKCGNTIVFITHDLSLARDFADRTAVMQGGRIVKSARPRKYLKSLSTNIQKACSLM